MDWKTELIKSEILEHYKSIREFASACCIPYTTLKSALDKGIGGTSVETVIKICDTLSLDISKLQKIKKSPAPAEAETGEMDIQKDRLIKNYECLNDEGKEKLRDYSEDLVSGGRYIKNNQYDICEEA